MVLKSLKLWIVIKLIRFLFLVLFKFDFIELEFFLDMEFRCLKFGIEYEGLNVVVDFILVRFFKLK